MATMKLLSSAVLFTITTQVFSFNIKDYLAHGHVVGQLGGFWSTQGKSQHVNMATLIGDNFTVTSSNDGNGLGGVGYFIEGQEYNLFKMAYGINGFYLAKTSVMGNVVQENLFTNLSYGYNVTHYPVYAVAKSTIPVKSQKYALTIDAGIGPNFMRVSNFQEKSLDGGMTIPDNIFSNHTTTTFSAMTGIGVKINNVFGTLPLECGYKFFYLGQGRLRINNNQVLTALNTGSDYANALMCSLTV